MSAPTAPPARTTIPFNIPAGGGSSGSAGGSKPLPAPLKPWATAEVGQRLVALLLQPGVRAASLLPAEEGRASLLLPAEAAGLRRALPQGHGANYITVEW